MYTTTKLAVLAIALVSAAGCAGTASRTAAQPSPRAADRFAHRVTAELGGQARADLRVCVGGDGAVTDASVVRTSGIAALDRALLADARTLRFQPRPARAADACRRVGVVYRPR